MWAASRGAQSSVTMLSCLGMAFVRVVKCDETKRTWHEITL
jgi:hypothetical protein